MRNRIEIAAPPEVVWQLLLEAEAWPEWYAGASELELADDARRLRLGTRFTWRTMGFQFTSVVHEFEPPRRLSWETRRGSMQGYHTWLLVRTESGTLVITEESQFGLLAVLQKLFQPDKLRKLHDTWLEALRDRAQSVARS